MLFARFFEPKPYHQGYLPDIEGHKVFFMEFGNPNGRVILTTHGGPGERFKPRHAARFDLKKYRVVAFDQRGCGKSLPRGELKNNTTPQLVADMERLLTFLKIKEKVIVSGASWASTLALLFALKNPTKVSHLLLAAVFIPGSDAKQWFEVESAKFYPDMMEALRQEAKGDLAKYYAKLINSAQAQDHYKAAALYGAYERGLGQLAPELGEGELCSDVLDDIKINLHYNAQNCFVGDNEILGNLKKIASVPTLIVHNRLDLVCPLQGAWMVHKALPKSKLVIVPELGHVGKLMDKTRKKEFANFLKEKKNV